jgi:protein-tyrosine phosphatase
MTTSSPQASRILKLEGGCNFRDLGGYRTRSGRELQWGKVYRTGVLSYFTANDQQQLSQLGVRAICDLRRLDEREREPTRWPDSTTKHLSWDDGSAPPTIRSIADNYPYNATGMHAAMIDLYRALPKWMAPRLRGMFERIAQGDVPVLIHCAAGKDRTGIAIALLLALLDVPHETIFEDYLLTNDAGDLVQFILTHHQARLGIATTNHPLLTLPEDVRRVLFAAHADYLHGAFDQIERDYGSLFEFTRQAAGVDEDMRHRVQAALLAA